MRFGAQLVSRWLRSRSKSHSDCLYSTHKTVSAAMASKKWLNIDNLNPHVINIEYAVRGPLVLRAYEMEKELEKGGANYPFDTVIRANIGDAHAMGQTPITFLRQLMACCVYPTLMEGHGMPEDVVQRAKALLGQCGGHSTGAYTISFGIDLVRKHIAEYIGKRDGFPTNYDDISLSNGATGSIKGVLQLFIADYTKPGWKNTGVMIPIPQYPLYSATLSEYGLADVKYYPNEENNWALDVEELERSFKSGKDSGLNVRVLVVINPGNPTGQVLSRSNIEQIIKFAHRNKLFIMADEVYQHNIYGDKEFHSFRKVCLEMGHPYDKEVEMASFMSCSKGYMGECGVRSGYVELFNMDPEVKRHFYKAISASLCPSVLGQICMDGVVNPPTPDEPSYELWKREKDGVLTELAVRAKLIVDTFNSLPGFNCNPVQGAMYAFPKFELPPKAIEAAKAANQKPDVFYATRLLEETGICIVAGSGFGQKEGTWHFRTTILPPRPLIVKMLNIFGEFHTRFLEKYS